MFARRGLAAWPSVPDGEITVDVSDNAIVTLPPALPASVRILRLGGNRIANLGALAPASWAQVTDLHAPGNRIVSLAPLDAATALESIELGDNFVNAGQVTTLAPLPYLRHLGLRGNALSAFRLPDGFAALRTLDLAGNQLTVLPWLRNLPSLRALVVDDNRLGGAGGGVRSRGGEDGSGRSGAVTHLRARANDLGDAALTALRAAAFPALTALDVDGNRLSDPYALAAAAGGVAHLSAARNQLCLPAPTAPSPTGSGAPVHRPLQLPLLETLRADANALTDLSPLLRGARRLRRLYAAHNLFSEVPAALASSQPPPPPQTTTPTQSLPPPLPPPGTWGGRLEVLDLSHCRLGAGGLAGVAALHELRALRLGGNAIDAAAAVVAVVGAEQLPHLIDLDLSANPLTRGFYPVRVRRGRGLY